MHSRIFVLVDKDDIDKEELFVPDIDDVECHTDYVCESDDLEGDVEWLSDAYKIKVNKKEEKFFINRQEFIRALKEEKIAKVENAKKLLNSKPAKDLTDIDIFRVTECLTDRCGFLFIYNDDQCVAGNFMDLLRELEFSKEFDNEIEIVASYDYHY